MLTHNDIAFTHVGDWINIKGNTEVRRVKGHYIDSVRFDFYDNKKLFKSEEVTVKFNFNYIERYNPLFNEIL